MTDLLKSLNSLKNKISQIETDTLGKSVFNEDDKPKEVVDNTSIISENIQKLKEIQKQKVVINVGGEEYCFSSETLKNTLFKNIFESSEKSIFYDGSPFLFSFVAKILRELQKGFTETNLIVKLIETDDEVIIKEMLKEIFPVADGEEEVLAKIKFEREIIVQRVQQNVENDLNPNNANNDNYNRGGNAAYNNYY